MQTNKRFLYFLIIDLVLISLSVIFSYLMRFDFTVYSYYFKHIPYVVIFNSAIIISLFLYYKVYRKVWLYASVNDLLTLIKAIIIGTFVFFMVHHLVVYYFYPDMLVPRSIYILNILNSTCLLSGYRLFWRIVRVKKNAFDEKKSRALIIGAGDAGSFVVKELSQSPNSSYRPVAFIDDNPFKNNLEIMGVPVLGDRKNIKEVVEKLDIDTIILAMPSASRSDILEIINICKSTKCRLQILPRINDLLSGKLSINMIRNVSVEDLLGREPVKLNLPEISQYLQNKVILISGAGGSIGSELARQVVKFEPKQLILLGHGENSIYEIENELKSLISKTELRAVIADIQDENRLDQVFSEHKPDVVFHAAAHKHVPLMESNPLEAIKNNVLGTKNISYCAHNHQVKRFVMISTDKAVNPTNVMGASKRIAELIIQNLANRSKTIFSAVRFGNVLGSRGSVIPLFKKQIENGGPVTVTHPDMIRYFMTIPEAVQLVIQAGAIAAGGEIFVLDMGKPVKISDLAHDLIKLSGLEAGKDIDIVYSGIRPGEKLFEEILTSDEGTLATKHEKIYIGKLTDIPENLLLAVLDNFDQIVKGNSPISSMELKSLMKQLVPTFNYEVNNDKKAAIQEAIAASLEVVSSIDKRR